MATYMQYHVGFPLPGQDFHTVYALMEKAFPPDERRSFDGQRALLGEPRYRLTVRREEDGSISAFFAVWEFVAYRFGEHIAVSDLLRGGGIGGELLELVVSADPKPFLLEVERPETDIAARRIGFYERHGFALNRFDYWQPPLQDNRAPLPLYLMSRPKPLAEEGFCQARDFLYSELYHWHGKIEGG